MQSEPKLNEPKLNEPNPNWANRTLFHHDNLAVLRGMNSETVHLIATDPPFNKGRDFHATPDSLADGASFHDRWSWEKDVHPTWVDQLEDDWPKPMQVIRGARVSHGDDMGAFLCYMAVRLIEMHRILRQDGSLYLHCDPTASHYLKQLLDAIFGKHNFRNEITWKRTTANSVARRRFPNFSDHLLFYSVGKTYTFYPQYMSLSAAGTGKYRYRESDGRVYRLSDLNSPGSDKSNRFKFLGITRTWLYSKDRMKELYEQGRIVQTKPGTVPQLKRYQDQSKGVVLGSVWTDIKVLNSQAKERAGYPTQKPLALYERILRASSNEGDIVLDPFCGCGTTLVAAERLGRQWVGIDIWDAALQVVLERLKKENLTPDGEESTCLWADHIHYRKDLPERTDDQHEAVPPLRTIERGDEPKGRKMSRAEMLETLLRRHGNKCQGCDRQFDDQRYLELDHNTPRSDGGLNHISNRVLLCGPCNKLKSNQYTLSGLRRLNKKLSYMSSSS